MNAGYLRLAVALWIVALVVGGYAESYSNRPTADDMSEYVAQGIVRGNAVRERELAVNRSQSFLPYCGVWQPYIVSLQQELETLAPIYIDHENGPLNTNCTSFLYFTLATWRATAGLNTNGFRRSVDGTMMLYGQMQAGDVIGAWIFEDLQKGFGALKWTLRVGSENPNEEISPSGGGFGTCALNKAAHDSLLASLPWTANPNGTLLYGVHGRYEKYEDDEEGYGGSHFHGNRVRGKGAITNIPSMVPHSADLYFYPQQHPSASPPIYEFNDVDGLGLTEGVFWFFCNFAESSDVSHVSAFIGNTRANCFNILGWVCGQEGEHVTTVDFFNSYWLLKWNFTNQSP